MSLAAQFIHSCTIKRPTSTKDAYGATKPVEMLVVEEPRCRLVTKTQTVVQSDIAERAVVTRYVLLLPRTSAIKQGDQIAVVRDAAQNIIGEKYTVSAVLPRRSRHVHHISCELERIP